jgi:trypsin-like peptidase/PEGA domain-containing protein
MPFPSRLATALLALALLAALSAFPAAAEKLRITSNPSGASVTIDGIAQGVTPFEKDYPGGYFHRPHTAFGSRLEHPMAIRVSLTGYSSREMTITEGPMNWIALNGKNHGEYFLFKTDHFHVNLDPLAATFDGSISERTLQHANSAAQASVAAAQSHPDAQTSSVVSIPSANSVATPPNEPLSLEEVVRRTKPAVIYLKALNKSGSGFFVTETGVIATNAHVARDEESLLAVLPGGVQLDAKVVYIDPELDIALLKVAGAKFPCLTLTDASLVQQGESVFAIGNPGDAMLFSVTKGIVSAVGKFPSAAPAPGYRPTPPSILATAAVRWSTPAARSSASARKSWSKKTWTISASP